jgi:hypothetical protein
MKKREEDGEITGVTRQDERLPLTMERLDKFLARVVEEHDGFVMEQALELRKVESSMRDMNISGDLIDQMIAKFSEETGYEITDERRKDLRKEFTCGAKAEAKLLMSVSALRMAQADRRANRDMAELVRSFMSRQDVRQMFERELDQIEEAATMDLTEKGEQVLALLEKGVMSEDNE